MLLKSTHKDASLLFSCRYPILEAHTKDYPRACGGGTSLEARGGVPGCLAAEEGWRAVAADGRASGPALLEVGHFPVLSLLVDVVLKLLPSMPMMGGGGGGALLVLQVT